MKKIFYLLNKFIMNTIGFMLYPTNKLGKEEKNKKIHNFYK